MTQRSDIHDLLAARLRAARRSKGLSLEAVAKLSGVSQSMVSQIERGESSPTVATLWNLTQALHVDFAGLLGKGERTAVAVVAAAGVPVIEGQAAGVRIRILSPPEAVGRHEVYDLYFAAGATLQSEPHAPGCREHLSVLEGELTVRSGADEAAVAAGGVARYPADRPHRISASEGPARAILVVENG